MSIDGISLGELLAAGRGTNWGATAYTDHLSGMTTTGRATMVPGDGLPSGGYYRSSQSMLSKALHRMEQSESAFRKRSAELTAGLGGANDTATLALLKAESIAREVKALMLAKCIQKLDEHCNTLLKTGG